MGVEIEKKYRVRADQVGALSERLNALGGPPEGIRVFEENIIYGGPGLDPRVRVLRLRHRGSQSILTFKERYKSDSPVKHQLEEETELADGIAMAAILENLGYRRALVYEKRRSTWRIGGAEVVLDELPFGDFVEIEGDENAISDAERLLGLEDFEVEHLPYPELTSRHGTRVEGVIEARFQ
jgi:adenylate cyclase class 2